MQLDLGQLIYVIDLRRHQYHIYLLNFRENVVVVQINSNDSIRYLYFQS